MLADKVLVVLNRAHGSKQVFYAVSLHVVPGFCRQPTWGDDEHLLAATRLFLTVRAPMLADLEAPYARVKALERSGASCYMAMPRQSPCGLRRVLDPAALYSTLLIGESSRDLDIAPSIMIRFLWNVVVPKVCPRCDTAEAWSMCTPRSVVCHACGNVEDVSECQLLHYLE